MLPPKPKCLCEEDTLQKGDKLYECVALNCISGLEKGFAFVEVPIKFCPECGKELPDKKDGEFR